jgi:hypothetical protein
MTSSYVRRLHDISYQSESTIQDIALNVGLFVSRLKLFGQELSKLLRRFVGKLSLCEDSTVLGLNLLFVHSKNTRKKELVACFHIDLSYPNTPVEVDLKGMNTDELEKLLVKNAKPGIGYLTRSCDVISAYLRNCP